MVLVLNLSSRRARKEDARGTVSCVVYRRAWSAEPSRGGFEVAEIRSDPVHTCSNKSYATGILIVPDVGAGRPRRPWLEHLGADPGRLNRRRAVHM